MVIVKHNERQITIKIGTREVDDVADSLREILATFSGVSRESLDRHQRKAIRTLERFWDDLEALVETDSEDE